MFLSWCFLWASRCQTAPFFSFLGWKIAHMRDIGFLLVCLSCGLISLELCIILIFKLTMLILWVKDPIYISWDKFNQIHYYKGKPAYLAVFYEYQNVFMPFFKYVWYSAVTPLNKKIFSSRTSPFGMISFCCGQHDQIKTHNTKNKKNACHIDNHNTKKMYHSP